MDDAKTMTLIQLQNILEKVNFDIKIGLKHPLNIFLFISKNVRYLSFPINIFTSRNYS